VIYQVRWKRTAQEELADVWLTATSDDREAVTRAAQNLDQQLRIDAHELGESRPGDERIVFDSPLAAVFEVDQEHSVVRVLQIWRY
jgi:hypothetical protein